MDIEHISCPQCQASSLTGRHCKAICTNCGYVESCEDLFEYQNEDLQTEDEFCHMMYAE